MCVIIIDVKRACWFRDHVGERKSKVATRHAKLSLEREGGFIDPPSYIPYLLTLYQRLRPQIGVTYSIMQPDKKDEWAYLLPAAGTTLTLCSSPTTFTPIHPFAMEDPKSWCVGLPSTPTTLTSPLTILSIAGEAPSVSMPRTNLQSWFMTRSSAN